MGMVKLMYYEYCNKCRFKDKKSYLYNGAGGWTRRCDTCYKDWTTCDKATGFEAKKPLAREFIRGN